MANAVLSPIPTNPNWSALPSLRKTAIVLHSKIYFTGVPCKRGHVCPRQTANQFCLECKREVDARCYAKNAEARKCKVKTYASANKAKIVSYGRIYYAEIKKRRASDPVFNLRWLERAAEATRRYYAKHPDKAKAAARAARLIDPERTKAATKAWREKNAEKTRVHWRNRRSRKQNAEGRHTAEDVAKIRKMQRDKCAYCKVKLQGCGHVDHIRPLVKGGSNWPSNLQILCEKCNTSKGSKDAEDFVREMALLI